MFIDLNNVACRDAVLHGWHLRLYGAGSAAGVVRMFSSHAFHADRSWSPGAVLIVFWRYLVPFRIPHIVRDLEFDTDLLYLLGAGERKFPELFQVVNQMENSSGEDEDFTLLLSSSWTWQRWTSKCMHKEHMLHNLHEIHIVNKMHKFIIFLFYIK